MPREDTKLIKQKYSLFHKIIFNERYDLFSVLVYDTEEEKYQQVLDDDGFFECRWHTMYMHDKMMKIWRIYLSNIRSISKRYDKKKLILKRKAYRSILRPYFCTDISEIILGFIC